MNGEGLTVDYQQGYCDGMRLIRQHLIAFNIQHEELWEHINRETDKEQKLLAELKEEEELRAHENNECGYHCRYCDYED